MYSVIVFGTDILLNMEIQVICSSLMLLTYSFLDYYTLLNITWEDLLALRISQEMQNIVVVWKPSGTPA